MTDLKTRTITISDEDWDMISEVAEDLGFGAIRGRSRAFVHLARKHREKMNKAKAE